MFRPIDNNNILQKIISFILFGLIVCVAYTSTDCHARGLTSSVGKSITKKLGTNVSRTATSTTKRRIQTRIIKQLPPEVRKSFAEGNYTQRILESPLVLYRYHGSHNANPNKYAFLTPGKYRGEVEARRALAIPTVPTELNGYRHLTLVSTYQIPKGTLISEGGVASLGRYPGGGKQIVVEKLPDAWKIKDQMFQQFRKSQGLQ